MLLSHELKGYIVQLFFSPELSHHSFPSIFIARVVRLHDQWKFLRFATDRDAEFPAVLE